jgi:hypothetical protein
MATTLRTHPNLDQREKNTIKVIDLLVQEIQNSLQVMRMEAELRLMEQQNSQRGFQGAFDAGQNIERLLRELRQCFCFLDGASSMNKPIARERVNSIYPSSSERKPKVAKSNYRESRHPDLLLQS